MRTYKGRTQGDAAMLFSDDAQELAVKGYVPVAQSWADGRPGIGRVMMLGLAAGMQRPNGTLTVTYKFEGVADATKICPQCAETVKAAAMMCRFCQYKFGS